MTQDVNDAVRSMFRRAQFDAVHDEDAAQQFVSGRGMVRDHLTRIQRAQEFGFSSSPMTGSEGFVLALGGRSDRAVALGINDPKARIKGLNPGTSVLYDAKGNVLFAKASEGIQIQSKEGKVFIKVPQGKRVYLGGNGEDATFAQVATISGPSVNVYAAISEPNSD